MLLIVAFALFALLIVAWIAMPGISAAQRPDASLPPGLPALGSHSV